MRPGEACHGHHSAGRGGGWWGQGGGCAEEAGEVFGL